MQMQANNTQEDYFNSDVIDLTALDPAWVIYAVAINHCKADTALISTLQIYNMSNLGVIDNAFISTAGFLPAMDSKSYPFPVDQGSNHHLMEVSISSLLDNGIEKVIFVERVSYSKLNFNQPSYDYVQKCSLFAGPVMPEDYKASLLRTYDLEIHYVK
jgi:hypothetical protein